MKNKSIRQLFGAIAEGGGSERENGSANSAPREEAPEEPKAMSPAERLGRALLDRLGAADDGVTEEELVEAILAERENAGDPEPEPEEEPGDQPEEREAEPPFAGHSRRPLPIKTGSASPAPVDYADMSAEQFRSIRKLLKKAAAEGRRIKL
ncbi:MAG: hypothetical protein J6P98_05495 [Clostridia bacterium]|nr:hypothetical protein [Clostridia bacterium]